MQGCSGPKTGEEIGTSPTSALTATEAPTPAGERGATVPETVDDFHRAVYRGELEAVKQALSDGVAVDALGAERRTALMFASFQGKTDIVSFLLQQGADPKATDFNGGTALMLASLGASVESVKMLLEAGADPNTVEKLDNWTALMFAASEGHKDVCQALLDGGADPSLKDRNGRTAFDLAKAKEHQDVVELLSKQTEKTS